MGKNALSIIRNDSVTATATITDTNNLPVNINLYKGYLTVKGALNTTSNTNDDNTALLQTSQTISDPSGTGVVSFGLIPSQTNILPGTYVYDVEVVAPTGAVYSSGWDTFTVTGDVTRATT
jgi:hypothetical protein